MLNSVDLTRVVELGIDLTTERDKNRLLEKMVGSSMDISGCDAGTLYLYKDNCLHFKIMKTLSQGVSRGEQGEKIDLPPVQLQEGNVCAYAAIHRELVNIPDVYCSERFDFSGPKKYDAITGYRTGSMLVIPTLDGEGNLIGVLQLMNKLDGTGKCIPFTADDEFLIQSIGSMTAISLANMIYIDEIKEQMRSFVQAFATAVDQRTPYNGSHTRKVTILADLVAAHINEAHRLGLTEEYFDEQRAEQLHLAAALHDIGKMIVPLTVMNKPTRLDDRMDDVRQRFTLLRTLYERDKWKGRITAEEYEAKATELADDLAFIEQCNGAGFLPDDKLERARAIAAKTYVEEDGTALPYLTAAEAECLQIRKGTLTADERRAMEDHVVMTRTILDKVRFNRNLSRVKEFAATHHEFLNGTGYPDHLTAEDLSLETRILTAVDIFDALTCTDRPYKVPIPWPKAFGILQTMVSDGQLDAQVVAWLAEALQDKCQADIDALAAASA